MQLLFHPYLQLSKVRILFTPQTLLNNSLNSFILLKKLNIDTQKIAQNYCDKPKKQYICTRNNCSLNKGEIPKWPTGADCNSADIVFVGSNPALPTSKKTPRVRCFSLSNQELILQQTVITFYTRSNQSLIKFVPEGL